jgi:beta-lactam-binding protein with PASTA domain
VRRAFARRPRGVVIEQNPAAGTRVVRGSVVEITVSRGQRIVAVPDVVGQDQRDAVAALRELDLQANIVQVPAPDPRGTVVAQQPLGGQRVQAVSTGGTETQTTTGTTTTAARGRVPALVGLRQTAALRRLEAAGLRGAVAYVVAQQPLGTVIGQRPASGTNAARGSVVRLSVSAGPGGRPNTLVANVLGQDQETATETLRADGFRVEVIRRAVEDPAEEGIVVEQQPRGGSRAPEGAVVTIYVGRFSG